MKRLPIVILVLLLLMCTIPSVSYADDDFTVYDSGYSMISPSWFTAYKDSRAAFNQEQSDVSAYCSNHGYTDEAKQVSAVKQAGRTIKAYKDATTAIDSIKATVNADIASKAAAVTRSTAESIPSASNATAASINAYLAGSPLAGYGQVFYDAATSHGLDPRLLPAVSCIESSKGACCFRSHNAWGWGSSSWPDWTTAINAMAAGVASGYGSGATPSSMGAAYCPGSQSWINNVTSEMEKM